VGANCVLGTEDLSNELTGMVCWPFDFPIRKLSSKLISYPSNLSNTSSLLFHALHSLPRPSADVNWCGFYVADPKHPARLILGPFQGHVACQTISFGKGVCGTAAADKRTQLVKDVEQFSGHIACDANSKSEIVVPIIGKEGTVVAIIDIDCAELDGFDEVDQQYLEELASILAESCDF
jgi:L-methionine (R)-S-oxide reductase